MTDDVLRVPEFAINTMLPSDRLYGTAGPGTGLKVRDAIKLASQWWDGIGRSRMRQEMRGLDPKTGGVPSGILLGHAWDQLDKPCRFQVIRHWYDNIGYPGLVLSEQPPDTWVIDPLAHAGGHTVRADDETNTH